MYVSSQFWIGGGGGGLRVGANTCKFETIVIMKINLLAGSRVFSKTVWEFSIQAASITFDCVWDPEATGETDSTSLSFHFF
jgi:hypothetical protein